ncbi:hypothetical protein [Brasilonema sp. UFV-L1]|uniref:hypothetical protein n=1 Tax=Brasilonema sp. UFV-L1 TaxID=2234130 RepID=UPI00145E8AEB|nr:hypothetical protein [Brasilonema sp. UFV-L1]NMG07425.1 hypothetical protein [Brasilonema sp. UFV-L1]
MNDQKLCHNPDIRKGEAEELLAKANQQLGEALKSYQQALDIYQEMGEETVATLISYLISQSKVLTVTGTDKSGNSRINLSAASGILPKRSRINRRK